MKEGKGFTLIEFIIAMAILALVAVPIFKSFVVSTKVNVKSYEKDKANIAVTNKIEEVKKNPYDFIKNHEVNTKTRYYTSLFVGGYYYCLRDDGTVDDKSFEECVKNYFKIFPKASGYATSVEDTKKTCKKLYNEKSRYYDKESFKELLKNRGEDLSKIKCIVNKCSITEYYDSNWNSTEEKSAKYKTQIDISRKAENHATEAYDPETLFAKDDKYYVPFMESYFAVLIKEEDKGDKLDSYSFQVFYNYSSEDFKNDLIEIYGTTTPEGTNDLKNFLNALYNFQSRSTEGEEGFYKGFYKVFNKHEKAKHSKDANPKKFKLRVEKEKTSIPVRIDFNNLSTKPMYNVEAYNMTEKPMELYIVHNETNDSEVVVKVSKGKAKKTEVYTTKNFAKTVYKIDVKVIRTEDNYNLTNYNTEKYVSGEEAQDFNFVGK